MANSPSIQPGLRLVDWSNPERGRPRRMMTHHTPSLRHGISCLLLVLVQVPLAASVYAQTGTWQLQAFHRNGQTFLTWNETSSFFSEDLPHATFLTILGGNSQRKYRIYR